MKKLLVLLGILAAFSFVACNKEADPVNPPASDPIENPTDTPDVPDTPDTPDTPDEPEVPAEIVLFDPANYDGEKIEIGGETFAKVTVDGYDTTFPISPAIDCSGVTTFKAKLCAPEANANFNLSVKIADKDNADISAIPLYGLVTEPKDCKAGFSEKQSWNTVSETKLAAILQPMVQDSTAGYKEQSGVIVYIGKIIAE